MLRFLSSKEIAQLENREGLDHVIDTTTTTTTPSAGNWHDKSKKKRIGRGGNFRSRIQCKASSFFLIPFLV